MNKLTVNQREAVNPAVRAYEDDLEANASRRLAFSLGYDAGRVRNERPWRAGHQVTVRDWVLYGNFQGSKHAARVTGVNRLLKRPGPERDWFFSGLASGRRPFVGRV